MIHKATIRSNASHVCKLQIIKMFLRMSLVILLITNRWNNFRALSNLPCASGSADVSVWKSTLKPVLIRTIVMLWSWKASRVTSCQQSQMWDKESVGVDNVGEVTAKLRHFNTTLPFVYLYWNYQLIHINKNALLWMDFFAQTMQVIFPTNNRPHYLFAPLSLKVILPQSADL